MNKGLFRTSKVYQWKRNKEESHWWLLCSMRLGLCKDIRLYMLSFLCDPIYEMEIQGDGTIRCWSETQLRLYRAVQDSNHVLFNAPPRSGTTTVLAGIVATMCLNATMLKKRWSIHITCVSMQRSHAFMGTLNGFLRSTALDFIRQTKEVFRQEFFSVCCTPLVMLHGSVFDMYILDNANDMNPAVFFRDIIPRVQIQDSKLLVCGAPSKDSWLQNLSRLTVNHEGAPFFHQIECDTVHLDKMARLRALYE